MDGERLYGLVEKYAAFGNHRSAGPADRPTAEWVAGELASRGLAVLFDDVGFDHCRIESDLSADAEPIEHLVVPYEWTGYLDTDAVKVCRFDAEYGGRPNPLDAAIAELGEPGQPLVLATGDDDGALRAINRRVQPGSGVPTVLVAGRDHARLSDSSLRLRMACERGPGATTNLFAATPAAQRGAAALVLSTPLTGWFGCAGERGTGVAVLIDLVDRFADKALLVVATGGHELSYLGAAHWADQVQAGVSPHHEIGADSFRSVVHVGASIAVEVHDAPPPRPLASTRLAMTSLPPDQAVPMARALDAARYSLSTDATAWLGEAEVFDRFDLPMLSFTGAGHHFHTPEDTPGAATSPAGLATAADAIAAAVAHLLAG